MPQSNFVAKQDDMQNIILSQISLADFQTAIADILDEKLKSFLPTVNTDPRGGEPHLSRKEVAKLLKISLPTLHKLTLSGKIKGSRLDGSRRILYKLDDVQAALQEIAVNKYKRTDLPSDSQSSNSNL